MLTYLNPSGTKNLLPVTLVLAIKTCTLSLSFWIMEIDLARTKGSRDWIRKITDSVLWQKFLHTIRKKSIINELISIKTYSLTHKKNVPVNLTIAYIEFVFSITSRNSPEVFFSNYVQWTFWCKNVSLSQGTIFCGIFCFIIKKCYSLSTSIH